MSDAKRLIIESGNLIISEGGSVIVIVLEAITYNRYKYYWLECNGPQKNSIFYSDNVWHESYSVI